MTALERRPDRSLARLVKTPAAGALVKLYRKQRTHLQVFLADPAVSHHNYDAERALRPSATRSDRKVTGGFRSTSGSYAYAALASVIQTAKRRGQSVFGTLVALMGRPILPDLAASVTGAITTEYFRRFGKYGLDLTQTPEPSIFELLITEETIL